MNVNPVCILLFNKLYINLVN